MKAELIYHGHSCFEIIGNDRILVDPYLKNNPMADIGPEDVNPDIIAVTHGHGDHLGDTLEIAERTGAPVVCIAEIAWYLSKFIGKQAIGMNMGGTIHVKDTFITMVRADHSSTIKTDDGPIPGGQAAGLIIDSGFSVYHLGDTGLFLDMKVYQALFAPQVALVPIGGYYTMDARQGALATEWISPNVVIPMHYDTWDRIHEDVDLFKEYVRGLVSDRVEVLPMKPGEALDIEPFLGPDAGSDAEEDTEIMRVVDPEDTQ